MKISYLCDAFEDASRVKAAAQHSSSELGSAFALALHLSLSMRTTEMARLAGKIIALAKQKILPRQAAKRSPIGDTRQQTYV